MATPTIICSLFFAALSVVNDTQRYSGIDLVNFTVSWITEKEIKRDYYVVYLRADSLLVLLNLYFNNDDTIKTFFMSMWVSSSETFSWRNFNENMQIHYWGVYPHLTHSQQTPPAHYIQIHLTGQIVKFHNKWSNLSCSPESLHCVLTQTRDPKCKSTFFMMSFLIFFFSRQQAL